MFNDEWETDFLFAQNNLGEPVCLVCQRKVKHNHKFDVERHYKLCHKEYIDIQGDSRAILIADLKKRATIKSKTESDNIMLMYKRKASFAISLGLAKRCRLFHDAEFFRELAIEVMGCLGSKGNDMAKFLEEIPLSRGTIAFRTVQISSYIFLLTKHRIENCKYFSLCLHTTTSTDINNMTHLIICVKYVDDQLIAPEEMFNVVAMHGRVNGEKIMEALELNVFKHVDINKLSSVCTDNAVMVANKNVLGYCLRKRKINVPIYQCIMHQQPLFTKDLCLHDAVIISYKIVNQIKDGPSALNLKFKSLLNELDADYEDLNLNTDLLWLSKGKCLQKLFNLRKEVFLFFTQNINPDVEAFVSALEDKHFISNLAFLCDITQIINELNILLQSKNGNIFDLVRNINNFQKKIEMLLNDIKNEKFSILGDVAQLMRKDNKINRTDAHLKIFEKLSHNFSRRFKDFNIIKHSIDLYYSPLTCNIEEQKIEFHLELARMRADFLIAEIDDTFWKQASDEKYPMLKSEIYKLYSMFGSAYNCKPVISSLKILLSRSGGRMDYQHIRDIIRIKNYENDIDIDEIALSS